MRSADHTPLPEEGGARYLRERLGLEIRDWARILGVAPLTVQRWEQGTPPSGVASEVLRGLTQAIRAGVDPGEIRDRLNLGLAAFIAAGLTTKPGKRP